MRHIKGEYYGSDPMMTPLTNANTAFKWKLNYYESKYFGANKIVEILQAIRWKHLSHWKSFHFHESHVEFVCKSQLDNVLSIRLWPMREDVTYVTTSSIGRDRSCVTWEATPRSSDHVNRYRGKWISIHYPVKRLYSWLFYCEKNSKFIFWCYVFVY